MKNNTYLVILFAFMAVSCLEATKNSNSRGNTGDNTPETSLNELRTSDLTKVLMSHVHRTVGTQQYSYTELNKRIKENVKPAAINTTPKPENDNDEIVVAYNTTPENCGYGEGIDTISERLNDCKSKNGANYQWKGGVNGNSGEGTWSLVYVSGQTKFWIDANTGLIWTPPMGETIWNNASGSGVADTDKRCTPTILTMFSEGEVSWRLPNRNEFLQAHLNGSRHVITHLDKTYWTATTIKSSDKAWAIKFSNSVLEEADKDEDKAYSVICIGEVLK